MKSLGVITISLIRMFYNPIIIGFGCQVLWTWFVVPLGLPAISIASAIGMQLTLAFFMIKESDFKNAENRYDGMTASEWGMDCLKSMWVNTFVMVFFLAYGFILHKFFM